MEIYNQGRLIGLEELILLAEQQKVSAWMIGELHGEKTVMDFERQCIRRLRPEYILMEGDKLIGNLNYDENFNEIAKIINCDTADEKARYNGAKGALIARYGTTNFDEIAGKHYGLKDINYMAALRNDEALEQFVFSDSHNERLESDEAYSRWWDDIHEIQEEGEYCAIERKIGENISLYIDKSEKPPMAILGDYHLKPRAGNIFKELGGRPLMVLNPLEIIDKTKKLADGYVEWHDYNNNANIVVSYNATILWP